MAVAEICKKEFDARVRSRGKSYFSSGSVTIVAREGKRISAAVWGSSMDPYRVTIDWSNEHTLGVSCSCPYYEGSGPCKHIWATLLQLDNDGTSDGIDLKYGDLDLHEPQVIDTNDDYASDDEFDFVNDVVRPRGTASQMENQRRRSVKRGHGWKRQFDYADSISANLATNDWEVWDRVEARQREVWYVLNVGGSLERDALIVEFFQRQQNQDGRLGKLKRLRLDRDEIRSKVREPDDELLSLLFASDQSHLVDEYSGYYQYYYSSRTEKSSVVIPHDLADVILPTLCFTKRFIWQLNTPQPLEDGRQLGYDARGPWHFELSIDPDDKNSSWVMTGHLVRENERRPITDAVLVLSCGIALMDDQLCKVNVSSDKPWIELLRETSSLRIPYADKAEFLRRLWQLPSLELCRLPDDLKWPQTKMTPRGKLMVLSNENVPAARNELYARLSAIYDEHVIPVGSPERVIVDKENQRIIVRDRHEEAKLLEQLLPLGAKPVNSFYYRNQLNADVSFTKRKLSTIVEELVQKEWIVEAEGARIRRPGSYSLSVSTNVDWFELNGEFDFDGISATLPELLEALRNGEKFIRLGDGSKGMLPSKWLEKYGPIADLGEKEEESVRFRPSQGALLDALLAAQESEVKTDRGFKTYRKKLSSFQGIQSKSQPRWFQGKLRAYQKDGLSWLHFLKDFHFGGCLADDMGLGKTIQVLALLESRRTRRMTNGETREPSLAVVPRSLIFNWLEEADRFTPKRRVLNYTGTSRRLYRGEFSNYDLVLTTYGTLRRDIAELNDTTFDYAILDEAQAIKNANSQAAKACRIVKAHHRLAMTGTPIENHLGELWSLFDFLNPGMLGRSAAFKTFTKRPTTKRNVPHRANGGAVGNGNVQNDDDEVDSVELLATAMRPFILRRTKQEVLTDLPEKTEQTLYCEMKPKQRRLYDELKDYYRASLDKRIQQSGIKKAKIHVLEALLRLRQAACHPGLLDEKKVKDPSAKTEVLLEQLAEVIDEGHKVLVFSQFTSLLSLVRDRLDQQRITYEYLDGRTRNRKEKVDRFQNNPTCPLFLISLKAGGQGLNLTAADYVYILDPWWNPAVEAQAVDRAHRIGQGRSVFAYRLICRNTVEEKILELQQDKRELADAIISADNSVIQNLTADDLQLLLT